MQITDHKIIVVNETTYSRDCDDNPVVFDSLEVRVSTRKIAAFLENHNFEFNYIQSTIKDALNGSKFRYGSRKYSFSDTPEWFVDLEPDRNCDDPVIEIEVEINLW